jgi:biofilm PGA synthesis N-glycosyltransferase PgaC
MSGNLRKVNLAEANPSQTRQPLYVLITPARNEAAFIELTIKSVVVQTVKPLKWVIVSDGSTDGTDEIVRRYAAEHKWIELVRMPERRERHFAGKVHAFNSGFANVKDLKFDLIGSLDADISFDQDYFSFLLDRFSENPRLGVGGTPFSEAGAMYDYRFASQEHVSGACQLFRRECFEAIGGYIPMKVGGIDLVAVLSARMKGWQTRAFTEKISVHHKITQNGRHQRLRQTFKSGFHDYLMGGHPVWELFRSVYHMGKRPLIVGGSALLCGYLWAVVTRANRPVSEEIVKFRSKEQMCRLRQLFRETFTRGRHVKRLTQRNFIRT